MLGLFETLDAALQLGKASLERCSRVFEVMNAPVEFCIGESDHCLGLGKTAGHEFFQSAEVPLGSLSDGRRGFGDQSDLLPRRLQNNVEMTAYF